MEPINKYPERIFFQPGEMVTLKQDLPMKPVMTVIGKETKTFRDKETNQTDNYFKGIKCFWFTTTLEYQEQTFNTKDLLHVL